MDVSRTIGIVLFTYSDSIESPRSEYAQTTLSSALQKIRTSCDLAVHIADDGSDPDHIAMLEKVCKQHKIKPTISNAARAGYGASYNLATQQTHRLANYFLMLEDDWELTRVLDLDPLVDALDDGLNCIRLGYVGWTQSLDGSLVKAGDMAFLQFNPNSAEPHVWSGHPRLETIEFQRQVGPWPVGIDPGATEFAVSSRAVTRRGVAWPLDLPINASQKYASLFAHIGAYQARTDQGGQK